MYLDYFALDRMPYGNTPDTDLFFANAARGDILEALVYLVQSGEAITKVVGEVGSGKTMLCRMLAQRLAGTVDIVFLANPSLRPEHVPDAIAFELGLTSGESDNHFKVMKDLQNYLLAQHAKGRQVVVFVEEAQGMPLATLEEIRLLSNLETQHHKLLQIVLFGQPELDEGLNAPHVRQIKDRITNNFYLAPLNRAQTRQYLEHRLRQVSCRNAPFFSWLSAWLIYRFSRGLMRRINILADKTLLSVYVAQRAKAGMLDVMLALGDCEFLQYKLGAKLCYRVGRMLNFIFRPFARARKNIQLAKLAEEN